MRTLGVLLQKELVEQWRTMRMPSLIAVFLFIGITSPAAAKYMPALLEAIGGPAFAAVFPAPTIADALAQFAKNMAQLGAFVMVVIAMAAVSSEGERGTLSFVLSKPVGRGTFLAAKLLGLSATLGLGTLVAAITAYAYTWLLFAPAGAGFALLALAAFLALLVSATITFAASAVTGSAVAAGGVGVGTLVLFGVLSVLPTVGAYTPAGAVSRAVEVVAGTEPGALAGPLLVQLAVIVAAFAVAYAAFRRQEI